MLPRWPSAAVLSTILCGVTVDDPCSFVMSSVALAGVLTQWQAVRVATARRKYGVNYPTVCGE